MQVVILYIETEHKGVGRGGGSRGSYEPPFGGQQK